ncbi:hypothetical protein AAFF_G00244020 [Aldrovandia affinis]|uniref:Uncharacterized protein n=1 Tax=Aldrovandia affinis TaxID=143900 RepID=A0AAD7RDK5_9TELE|nr:hypothetical protein AAFF_G00244020 [Aldrovandia affinis]
MRGWCLVRRLPAGSEQKSVMSAVPVARLLIEPPPPRRAGAPGARGPRYPPPVPPGLLLSIFLSGRPSVHLPVRPSESTQESLIHPDGWRSHCVRLLFTD